MGFQGWAVWGAPGVIGAVKTKTYITCEPYIFEIRAICQIKANNQTHLSTSKSNINMLMRFLTNSTINEIKVKRFVKGNFDKTYTPPRLYESKK